MASAAALRATRPTFTELFTPKLVTLLREGYGWADFRADALAGLTVAIVALPLSMAIAIGSGLSPDKGLYTAVVGGFLVSSTRRQPVSDRWTCRRLHRPHRQHRRTARLRWPRAGDPSGRVDDDVHRPHAPRHVYQIHSVSRHRRLHGRHSRHHLRQPGERASGLGHRQGACSSAAEARRDRGQS